MTTLGNLEFGYGRVSYNGEVPATPTTSETTGNVTINNVGQPGVPEHYEVSFMLNCGFEEEPVSFSNIFHWTVLVLGQGKDAPFSAIEAAAARKIAPMLRDVAQRIEDAVTKYDQDLASASQRETT